MSTARQPDDDYRTLYRKAFETFRVAALWNKAELSEPSPEHALVVARALRAEGDRHARLLAEQIERAVLAAEYTPDRHLTSLASGPLADW